MNEVIINGVTMTVGKIAPNAARQSSKWDGLKELLKETDDCVEGFKNAAEAGACAARLKNVWGIPCRSYTNLFTQKIGVVRIDPKAVEAKEESEEGTPVNNEQPELNIKEDETRE